MREPKFLITDSASCMACSSGPVTTATICTKSRGDCVSERQSTSTPTLKTARNQPEAQFFLMQTVWNWLWYTGWQKSFESTWVFTDSKSLRGEGQLLHSGL